MIASRLNSGSREPYASNWLERLREIKRIHNKLIQEQGSEGSGPDPRGFPHPRHSLRRICMDEFTGYTWNLYDYYYIFLCYYYYYYMYVYKETYCTYRVCSKIARILQSWFEIVYKHRPSWYLADQVSVDLESLKCVQWK